MEFFSKYKIPIVRSVGGLMLAVGFAIHFWSIPKEGMSANERAAANVARMEVKLKGESSAQSISSKENNSKFLEQLKDTQARQLEFLTVLVMIFGLGFLGYSFISKKDS